MRNKFYPILLGLTAVLIACIFIFSKEKTKPTATLLERTGPIALDGEWMNTKNAIEGLLKEIELNPKNYMAKLNLAKGYIQEGRITGNHGYYDAAALELLDEVIKNEPNNFDALCCKSTVLLSQHHFSDALKVAKKALPLNPNNAFIYGLMCDAYVELGNYKKAVEMSDKMISIRPDIRSYSRISYLREIHGDLNGAKQAAKLAISSGYPGLEETAWTRMILAHLHEKLGEIDSAKFQYKLALNERKNYPYAFAGLAMIEKQNGNYKKSIYLLKKADKSIIEYSFKDELTELYKLTKSTAKSKQNAEEVIKMLEPNEGDESVSGHGHYADRELAYAYLKTKNYTKALYHAQKEFKRRPKNIDVCETLAWTYYKNKQYKKANYLINLALKTKCQNPTLLIRAGLINIKNKHTKKGKELIKKALANKPLIHDFELKKLALNY